MEKQRSRNVALGGLLSALGWLILLLTLVLPTGRIFLLTLASFLVVVAWGELSPVIAVVVYGAISALGMIYPGLYPTALFILFFGTAPLISLFLTRYLKGLRLWLARHAILTALMAASVAAIGLHTLIKGPAGISSGWIWLVLIVLFQGFLVAYEYLLRAFTHIWVERIRPGTTFR